MPDREGFDAGPRDHPIVEDAVNDRRYDAEQHDREGSHRSISEGELSRPVRSRPFRRDDTTATWMVAAPLEVALEQAVNDDGFPATVSPARPPRSSRRAPSASRPHSSRYR